MFLTIKNRSKVAILRILIWRNRRKEWVRRFIYNHHLYLPTYKYRKLSINRKIEIQQYINWLYRVLENYVTTMEWKMSEETYTLIRQSYDTQKYMEWHSIRAHVKLIHERCEVWEIVKPWDVIIIDKLTKLQLS